MARVLDAPAETLVRTAARVLTGALYVSSGYAVARSPAGPAAHAGETLARVRGVLPLPADDVLLVRANALAQLAAGAGLALGVRPRLSAAVLAGSLVPTTFAGHAFWAVDDPAQRQAQRLQFQKNAAMLGGLLFAVLDRPRSRG
jgi:putative oxidoreductase